MKKLIIAVVLAACSFQVGFSQYDAATQSKIKVLFMTAEKYLEQKEYLKAIYKVNDIEVLTNNASSSVIQNIKVKSYVGLKRYNEAKIELDKLYKMNPTDKVLKDIVSYSDKIDEGIMQIRLAEIKRKKDSLYAVEHKDEIALAKEKKRKEALIAEQKRKREEEIKRKERIRKAMLRKEMEAQRRRNGGG